MPNGDCVVRDEFIIRCGHPMDWTEMVHELAGTEKSLANAFSALTIARVGKENKDNRLVRESTKVYGQALKDLQFALFDPTRMHTDEVLIASMLLGLYEIFEGSTLESRSWLSHAQGAARLIEYRGPERHRSRQAHHVFLGSRVPTIYAAILSRKATYLATEEWRSIPWKTQHRTYYDKLVDTATDIPGLLADIDAANIGSANPLTYTRKQELLQDLANVQKCLDTWKKHVKRNGVARTIRHNPSPDDKYPYDTEYWFENHLFMKAHSIYWACSLVIAEAAEELLNDLQAYDMKRNTVDTADYEGLFDSKKHATAIAHAIPYCLQHDMGALGASIINFPANLSLRYFRRARDVPTVYWLSLVFKNMRNRGLQYNPQLLENQHEASGELTPTPKSESPDSSGSSDTGTSKSSELPSSTVLLKFVHEDPSRFYIHGTDDYH